MTSSQFIARIALSLYLASTPAWAAHYGTVPAPPPSKAPTLRIADHAPRCADTSGNCIETAGSTRAYPVADGDRVTIDWTDQAQPIDGVVELRHLYLPFDAAANPYAPTPITLVMQMPTGDPPQVVVEYAGTRHHVPLTRNAWQAITVYNPNERVLYVRLDSPTAAPPAN